MQRILTLTIALSFLVACRSAEVDGASTAAKAGAQAAAAAPDQKVFTWYDKDGVPQLATRLEEVPVEARDRLVISDLKGDARAPFAEKAVVADLTDPDDPQVSEACLAPTEGLADLEVGDASDVALHHDHVYLYSTEWCGYCKKAKAYLSQREIAFTERDVEKSPDAARELKIKATAAGIALGGVPVLDIRGTLVKGFNPSAIDAALAAAPSTP